MNSLSACSGNGMSYRNYFLTFIGYCTGYNTCTCVTGYMGPTCQVPTAPTFQNCYDIRSKYPNAIDGMYNIKPWTQTVTAWCDMTNGGYTSILRYVHDYYLY